MEISIMQYRYLFQHLRRGVTQYGPAPHKLIMLLAVIQEIESGRITQNQIAITDELVNSFSWIWHEYIHTGHTENFALPFFHLQNEGFWQLHAYPHKETWLSCQNTISTLNTLRDAVQYASLSQDLFELLLDPIMREELEVTLISILQQDGHAPLEKPCPFCKMPADREIIAENQTALAFFDGFPVSPGHTLIIPKRHVASYFDLYPDELNHINELSFACRDILKVRYNPQGFNLGVNVGETAGQSIFHCHVHLIPRYTGDVANPRGGVRGVIPAKQNY